MCWRSLPLVMALAASLALASTAWAQGGPIPVEIFPLHNSGVLARGSLTALGNQTQVTVTLVPPAGATSPGVAQAAHLRVGSCGGQAPGPGGSSSLGPVAFTLNTITQNTSTTTVDAPLSKLLTGYSITLERTSQGGETTVACGDIGLGSGGSAGPAPSTAASTPKALPSTGDGGLTARHSGLLLAVALTGSLLASRLRLPRSPR